MANLLETYIAALQANQKPYTPLTEEQMAEKAKNKYQAIYDQNRLSAQQQYDATKLARDQQKAELNAMYDEQAKQSAENYAGQQAAAIRGALSRGMQRSSYLGATVGNIGIKGNEAQQYIQKNREGSIKNITDQDVLAQQQLAAQIQQFNKSQLADQLAYQDELEQREYDRGLTAADRANQIAADIYSAQSQAAQNRWFGMDKLFKGNSGGGSSGGGSSSSSGGSSGSKKSKPTSSAYDDLKASTGAGNIVAAAKAAKAFTLNSSLNSALAKLKK